jgi:hypothetical protein
MRGKVLRDPHDGVGLIMVEGRQYPFSLHPLWKSQTSPKPGLPVDIDFGPGGQIVAITAVPESETTKGKTLSAGCHQKQRTNFLAKFAARIGIGK